MSSLIKIRHLVLTAIKIVKKKIVSLVMSSIIQLSPTKRLYGKYVLTCILDQLPDQIFEIQAFAACHVELIYCRRSACLVGNFVRIQGISLYYSSLNRIGLLEKVRDHRNVFCIAVVAFGLLLFLPQSAEELFYDLNC